MEFLIKGINILTVYYWKIKNDIKNVNKFPLNEA